MCKKIYIHLNYLLFQLLGHILFLLVIFLSLTHAVFHSLCWCDTSAKTVLLHSHTFPSTPSEVFPTHRSFPTTSWFFFLFRIVWLFGDVRLRLSHMLGREAAAWGWCSAHHRCPSSWCSVGRGSTAAGSPRCRRPPVGSLRQGRHFSQGWRWQ